MEISANNKCKAFTSPEQSKKLAKILAFESADMYYNFGDSKYPDVIYGSHNDFKCYIPCWSLAALLNVLPNYQLQTQDDGIGILCSCNGKFNIVTKNNSVDACVTLIEKLHEIKVL